MVLAAVCACFILAGCGLATNIHATDYCAPWKPIFASRVDVLTDGTARQIKDHDETGVKLGCWPAPKKAKPAPKQ